MVEDEDYLDETDLLKPYGFMPGKAFAFRNLSDFTLDDLNASLFKTTADSLKRVSIPVSPEETAPIVIELARTLWIEDYGADSPPGYSAVHNMPAWYMEGCEKPVWPAPLSSRRVRMYIIASDGSHIDVMTTQFISDEHASDGIIRVFDVD